jgi:hypothetical protein
MKLKTNSSQITEAKGPCWRFFPLSVNQQPVSVVKRNDGPSAAGDVVAIELVPSMSNCVSLLRKLVYMIPCSAPSIKPKRISESVLDQVVAHGQLGPKILNGVISDCQSLTVRNTDARQSDSEHLTFHVSPLSNSTSKLVPKGNGFFGYVHSRTVTPNATAQPLRFSASAEAVW